MSTIAAFTDLMAVARGHLISGIDTIQNEATKYRRYLFKRMISGLAKEEVIQSGIEIVDYIKLSHTSTFQHYNPAQSFSWSGTDSLKQIKVPWRFSMVHETWYDHEVLLSQGPLADTFKRVKNAKMASLEQSLWEGMEDSLWAAPDPTEMEGHNTTGKTPYSLRAFITEAGGAPAVSADGATSAWTTVMGQNPTTYTNWKNAVESYDHTDITNTLPRALDLMWDDVQYESPSNSEQYVKSTNLQKMSILTNRDGYQILMDLTRNSNDRLYSKENDLGMLNGALTYHGLPIERCSALETKLAYTTGKPRYWFVNFNHIKPIFHTDRYMTPLDVPGANDKPQAHVVAKDTWWNLWCSSRRQQGIVISAA